MSGNHVLKFFAVANFFKENPKQLERGENAYTSGHVKSMQLRKEVQPASLKGTVLASMKKTIYTVEVSIDLKEQAILSATCTCPRGQALCHHIAALLYYTHYNVSSTDVEQKWTIKAGSSSEIVKVIEELYGCGENKFMAMSGDISTEKIEEFKKNLGQTNVVGFSWLLKSNPEKPVPRFFNKY
ncbi:hypothetical protein ABEB36_006107 [Hypothenemus hampei]|uniref:SWIM-type domain-containing protein n=1 Tax=Hypothenemus hampei TaxID=57062 RepID=A0ABD1F0J0_HYPHA